jgi:predicted MFS family arabinose efflux permease
MRSWGRSWGVALRLPGARALLVAALVARLGFAATTLPALLLLAERFDGFTVAGIALAGFGITSAVLAPLRGRLVDRTGARGLLGLTGAYLLILGPAPWVPTSLPWLAVLLATLAGAVAPPLAAVARRGWTAMLGSAPDEVRTAAFSADSLSEEFAYVAGPALAGVGLVLVGAGPTFLAALAGVVAGGLALSVLAVRHHPAAQEDGSPRPHVPLTGAARRTVMRAALSVAGLGAVIGLVDTAVPALAADAGSPGLAGALLALYTAGSVIGVLVVSVRPAADPDRRRVRVGLLLVLLVLPLVLVREPIPLGVALVVAGLPIGPLLVTSFLQVDRDVPLGAATQAYAWVTTASNALGALSMAAAGVVIDRVGPGWVLVATPVAAAMTGIPAWLLDRRDRARSASAPVLGR